jgi:uncharacterized membrane protein/mono/diheme cytochrome c family protein
MMNLFLLSLSGTFSLKLFVAMDAVSCFLTPTSVMPGFWLWQFFGRLHPMIVHFPIVLLIVALLLEVLTFNKKNQDLRRAISVLLLVGAVSAVMAVLFGWLLKTQDQYTGELLVVHQWAGVATAVLATVAVILHRATFRHHHAHLLKTYRGILIIAVIGVTVAGHYGAALTHGPGFLTSVLPWNNTFPRNPDFDITKINVSQTGTGLDAQQVADLNLEVRSIFAHNCYKCHSSAKVKGELRLDKKKYVMKGGESGDVISAGHPEKSEMIRRLLLPREDEESMPPKGKKLSEKEIATLQLWIKIGAPWSDKTDEKSVFRVAELAPRKPRLPADEPGLANPIDRFVNTYFEEHNIPWVPVIDDRLFIRRVYLDIIGLLPSPEEINAFLVDNHPAKRELLVKQLLNREDDYAQHWLSFWNDALRNDYSGTGYITGGRFAITEWLYEALKTNKPYDVFVRDLISPDKRSEGFIRGIQWRGTVNASQRVEMQAAQNISQVFLGLNLKCASCHDSFVSDWKLRDAYAFANIFSDSALEISRCDVPTGEFAGTKIIFSELGTIDSTVSVDEKLKQLATFLTAPENGRLYRTIVNRIWAQLMGRGIVAPVDLMDNVPWSQDLLDWLASDFAENGKDLKDLIYKITTSRSYQTPSVEVSGEEDLLSEDYVFKGMHRRRLSAEQFADAVSTIISPVYPDTLKAFDPSKKFNVEESRPYARAALVKNDRFLTALGRPNRENVLTSRSSQANLLQALELTNGDRFNEALGSGARKWKEQYSSTEELVKAVYRKALGRDPEADELKVASGTLGGSPDRGAIEDFLWAVMLLPEFQLIY